MSTDPSAYYAVRYQPIRQRDQVWRSIARYLDGFLQVRPDSIVLELGTGYGSWIRSVGSRRRYALDINPELPLLFEKLGLSDVNTCVGNCTRLEHFESSWAEVILASNLLEHLVVEEVEQCLSEIHRVLRPGGRLCLIQPNFALCPTTYFDDYTHRTVFTHVSLPDWVESKNFHIQRVWPRFLPLTMKGNRSTNLAFLVPLYLRSPWKPMAGQMAMIAVKNG